MYKRFQQKQNQMFQHYWVFNNIDHFFLDNTTSLSKNRQMDGWINGWMDGWMDEQMDGQMDEWVDEWMDGWLDE